MSIELAKGKGKLAMDLPVEDIGMPTPQEKSDLKKKILEQESFVPDTDEEDYTTPGPS